MKKTTIIATITALLLSTAVVTRAQQRQCGSWEFTERLEEALKALTGHHFQEQLSSKDYQDISRINLYADINGYWAVKPEKENGKVMADSIAVSEGDVRELIREETFICAEGEFAKLVLPKSGTEGKEDCNCPEQVYTNNTTLGPLANDPFVRVRPKADGSYTIPKRIRKGAQAVLDREEGIKAYLSSLYAEEFFNGMLANHREAEKERILDELERCLNGPSSKVSPESCARLQRYWRSPWVLTEEQLRSIDQGWYLVMHEGGMAFVNICHCKEAASPSRKEAETPRLQATPHTPQESFTKEELTNWVKEALEGYSHDDKGYEEILEAVKRLENDTCCPDTIYLPPCPVDDPDTVYLPSKDTLPRTHPARMVYVGLGTRCMLTGGPLDEDLENTWYFPSYETGFGLLFNERGSFTAGIGVGVSYLRGVDYYRVLRMPQIGPYFSDEVSYTRSDGEMLGFRAKGYLGFRRLLASLGFGPDYYFGFEEIVVETITNTMDGTTITATYPEGADDPDLVLDARLTGLTIAPGLQFGITEWLHLGVEAYLTRYPKGWQYVGNSHGAPALQGEALGVDQRFGLSGISFTISYLF
ncbi:hypothetical protein JXA12_02195 [Candidatus Woesearchaeota archaeon]|nr:hypothetical protein [Candidatus Woesearchaeota archaeon]